MSIDWLSGLLLTALIFVPLERVLALRKNQRIFRRGWLNDVVYLLLNRSRCSVSAYSSSPSS